MLRLKKGLDKSIGNGSLRIYQGKVESVQCTCLKLEVDIVRNNNLNLLMEFRSILVWVDLYFDSTWNFLCPNVG